jgi:hypothetical protein
VRLRHLCETPIRAALLVQRFLQQPRLVLATEPARVGPGAPVNGDFIVLDPLHQAHDRRVADVICHVSIQAFVGFPDNAGDRCVGPRRRPMPPMREDQLQTLEMKSGLLAVVGQEIAQIRRSCGIDEGREDSEHLRLGSKQTAQLIQIEILQRCEQHARARHILRNVCAPREGPTRATARNEEARQRRAGSSPDRSAQAATTTNRPDEPRASMRCVYAIRTLVSFGGTRR